MTTSAAEVATIHDLYPHGWCVKTVLVTLGVDQLTNAQEAAIEHIHDCATCQESLVGFTGSHIDCQLFRRLAHGLANDTLIRSLAVPMRAHLNSCADCAYHLATVRQDLAIEATRGDDRAVAEFAQAVMDAFIDGEDTLEASLNSWLSARDITIGNVAQFALKLPDIELDLRERAQRVLDLHEPDEATFRIVANRVMSPFRPMLDWRGVPLPPVEPAPLAQADDAAAVHGLALVIALAAPELIELDAYASIDWLTRLLESGEPDVQTATLRAIRSEAVHLAPISGEQGERLDAALVGQLFDSERSVRREALETNSAIEAYRSVPSDPGSNDERPAGAAVTPPPPVHISSQRSQLSAGAPVLRLVVPAQLAVAAADNGAWGFRITSGLSVGDRALAVIGLQQETGEGPVELYIERPRTTPGAYVCQISFPESKPTAVGFDQIGAAGWLLRLVSSGQATELIPFEPGVRSQVLEIARPGRFLSADQQQALSAALAGLELDWFPATREDGND